MGGGGGGGACRRGRGSRLGKWWKKLTFGTRILYLKKRVPFLCNLLLLHHIHNSFCDSETVLSVSIYVSLSLKKMLLVKGGKAEAEYQFKGRMVPIQKSIKDECQTQDI